jgi:hypothetical protein
LISSIKTDTWNVSQHCEKGLTFQGFRDFENENQNPYFSGIYEISNSKIHILGTPPFKSFFQFGFGWYLARRAPLFKSFFKREPYSPIDRVKIPQTRNTLSKWQNQVHIFALVAENMFSVARTVPKL